MTEGDILRALSESGVGVGKFTESNGVSAYQKMILEISNDLMDSFRVQIEKDTKSDNGALKSSVTVVPTAGGADIVADYYYKFIDSGVDGVGQFGAGMSPIRGVQTGSPYKFKNLGVPSVMAQSIREWSGASIEQSYAIAVNIKNYGIKPKHITESVITDEVLERISNDLLRATGLIVEIAFEKSIK